MKSAESPKFDRFRNRERKAVRISNREMVEKRPLNGRTGELPLLVEPKAENVHLASWIRGNRAEVAADLLEYGALLFRGFGLDSVEAFREVTTAACPDLLDYRERAAPRHEVGANVFTSTEFPKDQKIPLHHEMSYSHNWPLKLFFYCDEPPTERGRTPVADDRVVIERIDPEVKEEMIAKGVMYVRNYGEGVDLPWREAFQTDDRAAVEAYCRKAGMEVEWRDGDRLRTRNVRQVLATHPETGETLWFNHAHMFHQSNVEPSVREALLAEFAPDELPRNAFFGDGSPIQDELLEHVRGVYEGAAVRFPWEKGDLLMVDNVLASHGREPYEGPRRILVAMAELFADPTLEGR